MLEISHIVLEHEPTQLMCSTQGHMFLDSYSTTQEDEADWLGASMLVPRDAALAFLKRNSSTRVAAAHVGVSEDLLNWRNQKPGVTRQLSYRRPARSSQRQPLPALASIHSSSHHAMAHQWSCRDNFSVKDSTLDPARAISPHRAHRHPLWSAHCWDPRGTPEPKTRKSRPEAVLNFEVFSVD